MTSDLHKKPRPPLVIGWGLLLIVAIMMLLALLGYWRISDFQQRVEQVVEVQARKVALATEMRNLVIRRSAQIFYMQTTDDPSQRDRMYRDYQKMGTAFALAREQFIGLGLDDTERALLDTQQESSKVGDEMQTEALALLDEEPEVVRVLVAEAIIPMQEEILALLNELVQLQMARNAETVEQMKQATRNGAKQLILLTTFGTVFALMLAIHMARTIHRHLQMLQAREAHERAIRENMSDALLTLNERGRISSLNRAALSLLGGHEETLLGADLGTLLGVNLGPSSNGMLVNFRGPGGRGQVVRIGLSQPDNPIDRSATSIVVLQDLTAQKEAEQALREARDKLEQRVIDRTAELESLNRDLSREIAEHQRAESKLAFLANHDALTGLPNRNLLAEQLQTALADARRHERPLALLFLDLDGFKPINDELGHQAGDELLRMVANRLRSLMRENDDIARLGGDEFTVLLRHVDGPESAITVARKILEHLQKPFAIGDKRRSINCSIGIALYPQDAPDVASLLRNADDAMYAAKAAGKGTWRLYRDIELAG